MNAEHLVCNVPPGVSIYNLNWVEPISHTSKIKKVKYDTRFFKDKKLLIVDLSITDCLRIPKDKIIISQEVVKREHCDVLESVLLAEHVYKDAKDIYESVVESFTNRGLSKKLSNNLVKIVWSYFTCIIDIGKVWKYINDNCPIISTNLHPNFYISRQEITITEEDIDSFTKKAPIDCLKIVMTHGDKYITMYMDGDGGVITIKPWRVCRWKKRCPNIKCGCTNRH